MLTIEAIKNINIGYRVNLTSFVLKTATRMFLERTCTPFPGRGIFLAATTEKARLTFTTLG